MPAGQTGDNKTGGEIIPGIPLEKLQKANDDLHIAFNEVLTSEDFTVEIKCAAAAIYSEIFAKLIDAFKILGG